MRENTTWKTANEMYPRDVARCDVGEMSFLERVDGRERVWNRTKKPAGAEALSR